MHSDYGRRIHLATIGRQDARAKIAARKGSGCTHTSVVQGGFPDNLSGTPT